MLSEKDKKHLSQVLEKYSQGRATPEESHFVEVYMNYLDGVHKETPDLSGVEAEIKEKLLHSIHKDPPVLKVRRGSGFSWRAAAAILLVALGAATCWILFKPDNKQPVITAAQDVLPGSQRAVLKLANGRQIILDSTHGNILQSDELTVNNDSGALHYLGKATMPEYHTLSVPQGGQYKLQLPDGTDVWLNAASSITYPTAFTGSARIVEVTGEAYFEVAKIKQKPFKVRSAGGSEIEVLGTHFNINAYTDEPSVTATLLEGRIQFSKADEHRLMTPGQQARLNKSGEISIISNVNTEAAIAWKEGYFYFDGTDLQTVMRQIARWYDVTVEYEGKIPDKKFSGEISKTNNISLVLEMLQATKVQFGINGKRIIVKQ